MAFFNKKKVVITGGAGFIGSHLAELLVKSGAQVTIPVLKNESLSNLNQVKSKIKTIVADLRLISDCKKVCHHQDFCFNLAAVVGGIDFNNQHPATLLRDNSLIGINILEAARIKKIKRFLMVSSACVYRRQAPVPTKEEEGFIGEPEPTNYGYGWAKRILELAAKTYHQEFNMNIAVVRPYNTYGPRDHFNDANAHVIPSLISRVFADENPLTVWGDGTPTRAFIYVKDVIKGMVSALKKSSTAEPINLGTKEEVSIAKLARKIIKLSGKQIKIEFDTSKPNGQPRRNCDTKKAKAKIQFEAQTSLDQGLKETIDWFQQNFS